MIYIITSRGDDIYDGWENMFATTDKSKAKEKLQSLRKEQITIDAFNKEYNDFMSKWYYRRGKDRTTEKTQEKANSIKEKLSVKYNIAADKVIGFANRTFDIEEMKEL